MNCAIEYFNFFKFPIGLVAGYAITPFTTYAHELGHASVLKLLFDNVEYKITLKKFGFEGAFFLTKGPLNLSRLGQLIGRAKSLAIMSAAGCISQKSSLIALRLLLPTFLYHDSISSISDIEIMFYALSTLNKKAFYTGKREDILKSDNGHDFVQFRMEAGLLPTCVLITTLVGSSSLSIYNAVYSAFPYKVLKGINLCSWTSNAH